MNDERENCPDCKEMKEIAAEVTKLLTERGISPCDTLITLHKGRCHITHMPACNLDIVMFTLTKIITQLMKPENMMAVNLNVSEKKPPEFVKKAVEDYLKGLKGEQP